MFEGVLNTPVFRLHLVMFCVIVVLWISDGVFQIPKWLGNNLPSFKYFRKVTLTTCLWKAWRDRELLPLSLLIPYTTHASCITTSAIQTNGNHHQFFIRMPILGHVLVHSVEKTYVLVVTVNLIGCCFWIRFFQLCSNTEKIF